MLLPPPHSSSPNASPRHRGRKPAAQSRSPGSHPPAWGGDRSCSAPCARSPPRTCRRTVSKRSLAIAAGSPVIGDPPKSDPMMSRPSSVCRTSMPGPTTMRRNTGSSGAVWSKSPGVVSSFSVAAPAVATSAGLPAPAATATRSAAICPLLRPDARHPTAFHHDLRDMGTDQPGLGRREQCPDRHRRFGSAFRFGEGCERRRLAEPGFEPRRLHPSTSRTG